MATRFVCPASEFSAGMTARVDSLRTDLQAMHSSPEDAARRDDLEEVASAVDSMYAGLLSNADPSHTESIIREYWEAIFRKSVSAVRGDATGADHDLTPDEQGLLSKTIAGVRSFVEERTVVDNATINNVLVNPETNAVLGNADMSALFMVKLELSEEGVILRPIQRDAGNDKFAVDFD